MDIPKVSELPRPLVMGVVNVTPDSFSDGGLYSTPADAIERGVALIGEGAHIVDVGGESTRPGAQRVDPEEEQARVLPVVAGLVARNVLVSIDTMNAATARAAAREGAVVVNDVSGGLADPAMLTAVADTGCMAVLMHWRAHASDMERYATYTEVATDVADHLQNRAVAAVAAGIDSDRIIIDPGLGFAKRPHHNWELLAQLEVLVGLGWPVLIGASRKRFVTEVARRGSVAAPTLAERDHASDIVAALAVAQGAWGVRVHNPQGATRALAVAEAWTKGHAR